jgi:hypothetical protein
VTIGTHSEPPRAHPFRDGTATVAGCPSRSAPDARRRDHLPWAASSSLARRLRRVPGRSASAGAADQSWPTETRRGRPTGNARAGPVAHALHPGAPWSRAPSVPSTHPADVRPSTNRWPPASSSLSGPTRSTASTGLAGGAGSWPGSASSGTGRPPEPACGRAPQQGCPHPLFPPRSRLYKLGPGAEQLVAGFVGRLLRSAPPSGRLVASLRRRQVLSVLGGSDRRRDRVAAHADPQQHRGQRQCGRRRASELVAVSRPGRSRRPRSSAISCWAAGGASPALTSLTMRISTGVPP